MIHLQRGRREKHFKHIIYAFLLISNAFFDPGSNVAKRNSNFPKINLTLPDKKVLKIALLIKVLLIKKAWVSQVAQCPNF